MPTKMLTASDTASLLAQNDNFLMLTHIKPDGDACGSSAALCLALRKLGKTAYICKNPETTALLDRYVGHLYPDDGFSPDFVISVDTATLKRLAKGFDNFADRVDLCVDHHVSNEGYAKHTFIIADAAAAGEAVFRLCRELGVEMDNEIASLVYIAIATDTGCFRYSNTRADTLEIAAECCRRCDRIPEINRLFFDTKTLGRIEVEKHIYNNVKIIDNILAVVTIPKELAENPRVSRDDIEGVAAIPLQIEGVRFALTIIENDDGNCRLSARSSPGVNANDFCSRFGGGGHCCAAGATIPQDLRDAEEMLVREAREFVANV